MKKIILVSSFLALMLMVFTCNKDGSELPNVQNVDTLSEVKKENTPVDIKQLPVDVQEYIQNMLAMMKSDQESADSRSNNSKEDVIERGSNDVVGHSTLKRRNNGIHINWHSSGHVPGDAVTLWIVVAGWDENCNPFFIDALYGGGKVINNGGILNLNYFLANGDNSTSILEEFCAPGPGPGMENAYDFIIHLLTRNHGPNIEGSEQLNSFSDCNPIDSDFCPPPPVTGDGSCYDYQDSIHYIDCDA